MSSLGDMWDDMWNDAGDAGSSSDHGFAFWEFVFGLLKIVGVLFGVLILLAITIVLLDYFNSPIIDWLINITSNL